MASLLGTFGVFAAGFLMRPVGGFVFGHIGDRFGRKRALELSVLLMVGPTTLVGLLPTYASIGLAAPLLLTLLRLLQGLSVGGEYIGSMSYLAEHAPLGRRGFLGSWSYFSAILGLLLGSGMAALCTGLLTDTELAVWGWHWACLGGLLIGLVSIWLRLGVAESPSFLEVQKTGKLASNPVAEALIKSRGAIATRYRHTRPSLLDSSPDRTPRGQAVRQVAYHRSGHSTVAEPARPAPSPRPAGPLPAWRPAVRTRKPSQTPTATKPFAHLYFWSGFILIGNPR
jgi:MFS family permease